MNDAQGNTVDELEQFLRQNPEIDAIDAWFPDLCGVVRGKRLTLNHARELFAGGLRMPRSTLLLSVSGSCLDPAGMGISDGDPDVPVRPVDGTLQLVPWAARPRGQVMLRSLNRDGNANAFEPRTLLAKVLQHYDDLGLTPVVACELEFCLVDPERNAQGAVQRPVSAVSGRRHNSTQLMSMSYLEDFGDYVDDVLVTCRDIGLPVTALNTEYGGDQFEVNLHHGDDALLAADQAVALKQVAQRIAPRHGVRASFMAKPYAESAGSGMHWHVSLNDAKGGNVFDDGGATGSDALRHAVAGILKTMPEAMAFYAPNINSYRRFKPGLFVPVARSWGYDNRSVAVRIPGGSPSARRMEFRVPGADANPYLALASLLAGMHHGLSAKLQPPEPATGDAGKKTDDGLPMRIYDAVRALESAETLLDYFGPQYCIAYADCKRLEYDAFLDELSEREYRWYLRTDP